MHYTRLEVIEIYDFLFPEPLEENEYVAIPHGPIDDPWTREKHVQDAQELIQWLNTEPQRPWHYGIQWATKQLPEHQLDKRAGVNQYGQYRAWGMIVDIENKKNHVYMTETDAGKFWVKCQPDLPDFITDGVEKLVYTGGGIQAYIRFDKPMSGEDLKNLFYKNKVRVGALCESYEYKKNKWVDIGSFEAGHGQRLVGLPNPKYEKHNFVVHIMIYDKTGGSPIDIGKYLDNYSTRLDYINQIEEEREEKRAKRTEEAGENVFEIIKRTVNMIDEFSIKTSGPRRENYTAVYCPIHDNSKTSAASVLHTPDRGDYLTCYSCGFKGDVFDVWLALNKTDNQVEALSALAASAGIDPNKFSRDATASEKKPIHTSVVDVGSWLTGNGAILKNLVLYNSHDGLLGMRIPFNIKGTLKVLDIDWSCWHSPTKFKGAVMCQLFTSFKQYPKSKATLMLFLERKLMDPSITVKDESIDYAAKSSMTDQFLTVLRSVVPLTPENISEYMRITSQALSKPTPKPDWWEDAADFLGPGRGANLFMSGSTVALRDLGVLGKLQSEFGRVWGMNDLLKQLVSFNFRKRRKSYYRSRRIYVWETPIDNIGIML